VTLERLPHGYHVARVTLGDLGSGENFVFRWESYVLAFPHDPKPIPEDILLPLNDVPEEIAPWLAGTWCCNKDDPAIKAVAEEIRADAGETADVVIPATLERMSKIFSEAKGRVESLTATEALTKIGSCTSCANLGAALLRSLLRSHGIPARIIAGYPTWSGPLQTHYVVEYWLPGIGWRVMETSRCLDDRPGYEQIEVALVRPEDESEERAGWRSSIAGGVPYLSLTEYHQNRDIQSMTIRLRGDMPDKPGCNHQAVSVASFEAEPELWRQAREVLSARWSKSTSKAVESGDLTGLEPSEDLGLVKSLGELLEAASE